jgi:hypothetical protein
MSGESQVVQIQLVMAVWPKAYQFTVDKNLVELRIKFEITGSLTSPNASSIHEVNSGI